MRSSAAVPGLNARIVFVNGNGKPGAVKAVTVSPLLILGKNDLAHLHTRVRRKCSEGELFCDNSLRVALS